MSEIGEFKSAGKRVLQGKSPFPIGMIVLYFAAILLLAISGGFSTDAARRVTSAAGYSSNASLKKAHSLLTGVAVATWVGTALLITANIIILFTIEETFGFIDKLITGMLILTLLLVILVGGLSAYAASAIKSSGTSNNNGSYSKAIIGAVLALGVFGLAVVAFIVRIALKNKKKKARLAGKEGTTAQVTSQLQNTAQKAFSSISKFGGSF